jgi:hypothetical protein
MLTLYKGLNRAGVSLPSPKDGNRSSFRNVMLSSYLHTRTMDNDHIPSDSELYIFWTAAEIDFSIYKLKHITTDRQSIYFLNTLRPIWKSV